MTIRRYGYNTVDQSGQTRFLYSKKSISVTEDLHMSVKNVWNRVGWTRGRWKTGETPGPEEHPLILQEGRGLGKVPR